MNLAMRKAARDVCLLRDPDQAKENLPNRFSPGNARTKMIMVREGGLEPPRLAAPDPKSKVRGFREEKNPKYQQCLKLASGAFEPNPVLDPDRTRTEPGSRR